MDTFYKEFADKLLQYSSNRNALLKLIYDNRTELLANYLHDENGENDLFEDIDPFTVFGLFNRGIKLENRIHSAELFKKLLNLSSVVPNDFTGIPIVNNQKSHFFRFRSDNRKKDDIQNLWDLFIKVVNNKILRRSTTESLCRKVLISTLQWGCSGYVQMIFLLLIVLIGRI